MAMNLKIFLLFAGLLAIFEVDGLLVKKGRFPQKCLDYNANIQYADIHFEHIITHIAIYMYD